MYKSIKDRVKQLTDRISDSMPDAQVAVPLGLAIGGVGLLGGGIYSKIKQARVNSRYDEMLDRRLEEDSRISEADQKKLLSNAGVDVPIHIVAPTVAEGLGLDRNAAFAPDPGEIVADERAAITPIIAHEIGHAKSHQEGKQPSRTTDNLIFAAGVFPMLASLLAARLYRMKSPANAMLALSAGLAPAAAAAWLVQHRRNKEERRATDNAIAAISSDKTLNKNIDKDRELLGLAYDTYKYGGRAEWMLPAGASLGLAALGLFGKGMLNS